MDLFRDNPKVAIDFTAAWCGPCQRIGPKFEEYSEKCPNITFIKVDVDRADERDEDIIFVSIEELAQHEGINAMHTFKFYLDGTVIDEVTGASESMLETVIEKLNAS